MSIVIIAKLFIFASGGFPHFHRLVFQPSLAYIFNHKNKTYLYVLWLSGTHGEIIFFHSLRVTVSISLSLSD
nr:MAG TPA: hypothetical protein [Caudoviricetes sp.]